MTQNEIDKLSIEKSKELLPPRKYMILKSVLQPDFKPFIMPCSLDFILLQEKSAS